MAPSGATTSLLFGKASFAVFALPLVHLLGREAFPGWQGESLAAAKVVDGEFCRGFREYDLIELSGSIPTENCSLELRAPLKR